MRDGVAIDRSAGVYYFFFSRVELRQLLPAVFLLTPHGQIVLPLLKKL